jgi:hypothetical protein
LRFSGTIGGHAPQPEHVGPRSTWTKPPPTQRQRASRQGGRIFKSGARKSKIERKEIKARRKEIKIMRSQILGFPFAEYQRVTLTPEYQRVTLTPRAFLLFEPFPASRALTAERRRSFVPACL